MIVALALASHIPVSAWLAEDDHTIATAIDILTEQSEQAQR